MYFLVTLDGKPVELNENVFNLLYKLLRDLSDEVILESSGHEIFLKGDKTIAECIETGAMKMLRLRDEEAVKLLVNEIKNLYELVCQTLCSDCL